MKNGDEIFIASAAPLEPCLNDVGKILEFLDPLSQPLSLSQSREPPFLWSACLDTSSTSNADVILASPLMRCIHLVQQKTTTEEIAICGFCRLRFCRSSQCQNKEPNCHSSLELPSNLALDNDENLCKHINGVRTNSLSRMRGRVLMREARLFPIHH